jgi:hypothetical protein
MTAINAIWFFTGMAAGAAHIWMLWQAAKPAGRAPGFPWIRLPLIAGVLAAAAVYGGILPTAAGWGLAYFGTMGVIATRCRT